MHTCSIFLNKHHLMIDINMPINVMKKITRIGSVIDQIIEFWLESQQYSPWTPRLFISDTMRNAARGIGTIQPRAIRMIWIRLFTLISTNLKQIAAPSARKQVVEASEKKYAITATTLQ